MLGDFNVVEVEGTQGLAEQHHPGDDCGGAVGVQADNLAPAGFVQVGKPCEQEFNGREGEPVAVYASRVVRLK